MNKESVEILEKIAEEFCKTPTIDSLAEEIFFKHRDDFVYDLAFFCNKIAEEYPELEFILVIDQFERAPLVSYKILLGFIRVKPKCFHAVVSFKMEKESLINYRSIQAELVGLNAKFLTLPPMESQEIGEWIFKSRGKIFSEANLRRVRTLSGGFPFLISQWLSHSQQLDIEELKQGREGYCIFIEWCFEGLPEKCILFLRKISTLTQPLSVDDYERLTDEKTGECSLTLEELEKKWILVRQEDTFWFRHDLIKPCIEKNLSNSERIKYHSKAAKFFENELMLALQRNEKTQLQLLLNCAYHFHASNTFEKSLDCNIQCGERCLAIGALDLAENCYLRAIDDATRAKKQEDIMYAKGDLAGIYQIWGRLDEAYKTYQELSEFFKSNKDRWNEAITLHNLAMIEQDRGNIEEAKDLYNESLKIKKELDDMQGIATTVHQLATIEQVKGNIEQARELFSESLKVFQGLGNKQGIARTVHNFGVIEQDQGNIEEAKRLFNQSLGTFQELEDKQGIARTIHQLARIEVVKGNIEQARKLYNESLKMERELEDKQGIARTVHNLAVIEQQQGNIEKAMKLYTDSLEIFQELGNKQGIASTIHQIATIEQEQGNIKKAEELYNKSLKIEHDLGDKQGIAQTVHQLATIEQDRGNVEKAKELYNESLKIKLELEDKQGIAHTIHNLAKIAQDEGNIEEAKRLYNESLETFQELEDKQGIAQTLWTLGVLHKKIKQPYDALVNLLDAAYVFHYIGSPSEKVVKKALIEAVGLIEAKKLEEFISKITQLKKEYLLNIIVKTDGQ